MSYTKILKNGSTRLTKFVVDHRDEKEQLFHMRYLRLTDNAHADIQARLKDLVSECSRISQRDARLHPGSDLRPTTLLVAVGRIGISDLEGDLSI